MYVFVTYAEDQMMGILARGLRIAQYFNKDEVFFWNSGDDKLIKKNGYKYRNENFDNFLPPSEIIFPKNTEKIVFCDLPFNRPYQVSILLAAKKVGIPCITLENIYRRGQLKERVFANTLKIVDAMTLNGLSFFKSEKNERVHIVPPLIETPKINPEIKRELFSRFGIPENHKLIFSTGYNVESKKVILEIAKKLKTKYPDITIFISSASDKLKHQGNIILAPRLSESDFRQLLALADILLCKKGYLQILEGLALKKPVIPVGKFQGFLDVWMDEKLREVVRYYPEFKEEIISYISSLLYNQSVKKRFQEKVDRLHDGSLDGAKRIAEIIRKTNFHKSELEKTLLLSLALDREMSVSKRIIKETPFLLPVFISVPYHPHIPGYGSIPKKNDLDETYENDNLLGYGFNMTYHLASRDVYSMSTVIPWFKILLSNIDKMASESDKIVVIGKSTAIALESIVRKYRKKVKIVMV